MLIAGVDDAGRGAVLGPLVIAGVLIDQEEEERLRDLGVKDSKLLRPKARFKLYNEIRRIARKGHVIYIPPSAVDHAVNRKVETKGLNRLEALAMAKVIEHLAPDEAYVDPSEVSVERYRRYINERLSGEIPLIIEHKADSKYPVVSAASIVAKVSRDLKTELMRRRYGDFGSGYMSDRRTVEFLKNCLKKEGSYPKIVRRSWKPAKKFMEIYYSYLSNDKLQPKKRCRDRV